jgi:hypothetical protein
MNEEKELLTILTKEEYEGVLTTFKAEFGEPKIRRRLSLQCTNYDYEDVDTRIRITNGKAELMQKVGDWKNITKGESRTEITIPLHEEAENIVALYTILQNMLTGNNVQKIVLQFENYIWETKEFEIKLTNQFGKSDAYNCEIEVFDHNLEPSDIANKYNVTINPPSHEPGFWKEWNEKVNLNADKLTEEELLDIVKKYL